MNLVRNHILNYKRQIAEAFAPDNLPEIYHRETPPEMPRGFMARADEIRVNAKASLELYTQDDNYKYLIEFEPFTEKKLAERLCLRNVLGYARGLEDAIQRDDLITMRRHERPNGYMDSFKNCADRLRDALNSEHAQQQMPM